jgi:hypothetical protein
LTATAASGSQINLAWTDNSTNEINFLIERSPDNVTFNLVAAVTTGVTNYADTGLAPGSTYYYRVRAGNAGGNSGYSNVASATPALPAPLTITKFTVAGGNFSLAGSGGIANSNYYVLASTTLTLPSAQWTRVATNQFVAGGNFAITNAINSSWPQTFYRLRLP